MLWSYEISVKAAKGESIVEEGDFEKRIKQLKNKLFIAEDRDSLTSFYITNCLSIFKKIISNDILPTKSFASQSINYMCEYTINREKRGFGKSSSIETIEEDLKERIKSNAFNMDTFSIKFEYKLTNFKDLGISNSFNYNVSIEFALEGNKPKVWLHFPNIGMSYDEYSTFDQIENDALKNLVTQFDQTLKQIESKIGK